MWGLIKQGVKLVNVNARSELHGPDHVLALDLKIEGKFINTVLDELEKGLRESLYCKREQGKVAELFNEFLPDVRYPLLAPLKWEKEFAGYELIMIAGIDDEAALEIGDCKVNNFVFETVQGGSVGITFRIQCNPDEQQAAKLLGKIQSNITISLLPPTDADNKAPAPHDLFADNSEAAKASNEDAITAAFEATEPKAAGN